MTNQPGPKTIAQRIEELLQSSGDITPARMLELLKRADSNPSVDIEKELDRLLKQAHDGRDP